MRRFPAILGLAASLTLTLVLMLPQAVLALTASQVYERVKDSVVVIKAYDRAGKLMGLGSGVVLPLGDIVTNYHVFKTGFRHAVVQGGKAVPATVKAGDPKKDLCILSAPGLAVVPARLGWASRLKVGEPVYAVAAPQGLELSLSEGIVSQLRGGRPPLIQTTVAISQGSSGGGLFNAEGELVGIMTFYVEGGQSLNFAMPVEWVRALAAATTPGQGVVLGEKNSAAPAAGKPSPGGWGNRADGLIRSQDWQGLMTHGRQWTQAEPANALAWFNFGLACQELGRRREAIDAYREALRHKPNYAPAWNNLAVAYASSGNRNAALEAAKELKRYDQKRADKLLSFILKQ